MLNLVVVKLCKTILQKIRFAYLVDSQSALLTFSADFMYLKKSDKMLEMFKQSH